MPNNIGNTILQRNKKFNTIIILLLIQSLFYEQCFLYIYLISVFDYRSTIKLCVLFLFLKLTYLPLFAIFHCRLVSKCTTCLQVEKNLRHSLIFSNTFFCLLSQISRHLQGTMSWVILLSIVAVDDDTRFFSLCIYCYTI